MAVFYCSAMLGYLLCCAFLGGANMLSLSDYHFRLADAEVGHDKAVQPLAFIYTTKVDNIFTNLPSTCYEEEMLSRLVEYLQELQADVNAKEERVEPFQPRVNVVTNRATLANLKLEEVVDDVDRLMTSFHRLESVGQDLQELLESVNGIASGVGENVEEAKFLMKNIEEHLGEFDDSISALETDWHLGGKR